MDLRGILLSATMAVAQLAALAAVPLAADSTGEVRVLYIGDSVTDGGWGRSGGKMLPSSERNTTDLNHHLGHSYVYLCAASITADEPERPYTFVNRGISGNTLADLEARWEADAVGQHPDVLSVLVGINDIMKYVEGEASAPFDWDSWTRRYAALIGSARTANPELRVVLCAPVVAQAGRLASDSVYAEVRDLVVECRNRVEKLAEAEGAAFVPFCDVIFDAVRRHPSVRPSHWVWDGIHPSPAGHALMARAWMEATGL